VARCNVHPRIASNRRIRLRLWAVPNSQFTSAVTQDNSTLVAFVKLK
jgi:hypothetical protein